MFIDRYIKKKKHLSVHRDKYFLKDTYENLGLAPWVS